MKVFDKRDNEKYTLNFDFDERTVEMFYTGSRGESASFVELTLEFIEGIYYDTTVIKSISSYEIRNIFKEYFEGNYKV